MSENNIKTNTQSEEILAKQPYVNVKVKIYVIVAMIILAVISASLVILDSEDESDKNDDTSVSEVVLNI